MADNFIGNLIYNNGQCGVYVSIMPDIDRYKETAYEPFGGYGFTIYERPYAVVWVKAEDREKSIYGKMVAKGDESNTVLLSGMWWWKKYQTTQTSHSQRLETAIMEAVKVADHYKNQYNLGLEEAQQTLGHVNDYLKAITEARELIEVPAPMQSVEV